jgi:hypothetical protein
MILVLTLLCHGCPTQAIVAAFGLDERTVALWFLEAGRHGQRVHEHLVEQGQVDLRHVQADELWVKPVGGKVWMALALAVPSRLWLGVAISRHRLQLLLAPRQPPPAGPRRCPPHVAPAHASHGRRPRRPSLDHRRIAPVPDPLTPLSSIKTPRPPATTPASQGCRMTTVPWGATYRSSTWRTSSPSRPRSTAGHTGPPVPGIAARTCGRTRPAPATRPSSAPASPPSSRNPADGSRSGPIRHPVRRNRGSRPRPSMTGRARLPRPAPSDRDLAG